MTPAAKASAASAGAAAASPAPPCRRPRVLSVFGTRPEATKMAPLVRALAADPRFDSAVCVTGQHRQMLDQALAPFGIRPQFDLDIMKDRQTLADITTGVLAGMGPVLDAYAPDLALVHGDTTTSTSAALAAFYAGVPVGHVEAGLRTGNPRMPFPEEMNRRLTARLASLHFAPTWGNRANLLREGVPAADVFVTGNTAIDVVKSSVREGYRFEAEELNAVPFGGARVLCVEAHRRENLGAPLEEFLRALNHLLDRYPDFYAVYPVHLNPAVQEPARRALAGRPRALLLGPLCMADMHNLVARSFLVLSDSGGLQEEAPALGVPVLALRDETERPEAVEAGTVRLTGTGFERVVAAARELAEDPRAYAAMRNARNPYGDGRASERIVAAVASRLVPGSPPPDPFQGG